MQCDEVSADVRLFLKTKEAGVHSVGLGKGVIELSQRVDRLGSLNRAAQDMGMAYSKAWRIVKNAEEALGLKLFIRQGASGSSLTEEAKALMDIFSRLEEKLDQTAQETLDRLFAEYTEQGLFGSNNGVRVPPDIETRATPELIAQVRSIERQAIKQL